MTKAYFYDADGREIPLDAAALQSVGERARDVVVGSFELFASKTGLDTDVLVKALTFVTVIIGFAAAIAGLFDMSLKTPFFETGQNGFISVLVTLGAVSIAARLLERRRRWF